MSCQSIFCVSILLYYLYYQYIIKRYLNVFKLLKFCVCYRKSKLGAVWTGLNDIKKEGKFRWDKGNACCGFRAWPVWEPNNLGGHEDCVELIAESGKLNDLPCSRQLPFICEINRVKTVS